MDSRRLQLILFIVIGAIPILIIITARSGVMRRYWFHASMLLLATLGAGLSSLFGATSQDASLLQIFYWYVLPALPFIWLFFLVILSPKVRLYTMSAAAAGAVFAIAIPYCLVWIDAAITHGVGANIGAGLVYLALPVYLPLFMVGGSGIARIVRERRYTKGKNYV